MKGDFYMKKILVIFLGLVGIFFLFSINSSEIIIPNDAIRFRVVANSNDANDQLIKTKVRKKVEMKIYDVLKDVKSIAEAREVLPSSKEDLEKVIQQTLLENQCAYNFKVNYGLNYFPEKKYKGVIYEEGYYESLVVTLGEGLGDNWWCVLFPPLCLLEAEETEEREEVEYKFFVKELLERFF